MADENYRPTNEQGKNINAGTENQFTPDQNQNEYSRPNSNTAQPNQQNVPPYQQRNAQQQGYNTQRQNHYAQQQYYNIPPQQPPYNYNIPPQFYPPYPPYEQKANAGLAVLSWFIPLAGLVIYLTEKDTKPKTAKACGKCALASVIINVVLTIAIYVIFFVAWGTAFSAFDYSIDNLPAYEDILDEPDYSDAAENGVTYDYNI